MMAADLWPVSCRNRLDMNSPEHLSRLRMSFVRAPAVFGIGLLIAFASAAAAMDIPPAAPAVFSTPPIPTARKLLASDVFLGLENGSLVESVYFWNVWRTMQPDEAAIVLVTSPQAGKDGKYPSVTAVTVYSSYGVVWAHTVEYGKVPLAMLKPDDLRTNPAHCLDEYLKAVANLPRNPVPVVGSPEEQVRRAFDALHNPKKVPFFPVATGFGSQSLVFDWNNAHYTWQPATGAVRMDPPKDPITGRPLLCVKHGDLVEALVFVHDYQKLHPEEKAGLLFAPSNAGQGLDTVGLAAAAYAVQGVVHVRGYYFGDLVLDRKPHSFQLADLAALSQTYKTLLIGTIGRFYEKTHSFEQAPESYWANVYNSLPSVFPQSLPGDTDEMQQNRIYQRAAEAGIPCEIAVNEARGRLVVLNWQSQRLSYASNWNYYNGDWEATDLAQLYPSAKFLGLKNGSLIESIHFRTVWIKVHPDEDAIVLVTSPGTGKDGKYPPVTAVAVYTNAGAVWAFAPDYGTVRLAHLTPNDLKQNAAHCLDEYLNTVALLPPKPEPVVGTGDEQIRRAFAAAHDPKTTPYFPVAIMDTRGSTKMADGTITKFDVKSLVFDWNDAHYTWQPSTGAVREDPPKDPLTGRPFLCVKHGDLAEAIVFVHDLQRAHPDEKAVLLYSPPDIDRGVSTVGMAAAAYTQDGIVHVRSYYNRDWIPNGKTNPFTPTDLDDPAKLAHIYALYRGTLLHYFKQAYAKAHPHGQLPPILHDEIYDTLRPVFPESLPGDTAEMQENRVFERATAAGIPCVISADKQFGRLVVLHWRTQRFCYTGNYLPTGKPASYYDGIWDPNDSERLIDAILFAHDFRPEQPGDAVAVLPYRQLGLWDIVKGIAVYARAGNVYAHNPEVGDAIMPGTKPSDLADPGKYRALRLAANNAIHAIDHNGVVKNTAILEKELDQELQARIHGMGLDKWGTRKCVYELLMRPADLSKVEVPSVYEKLKAAGVHCQLYATTTERGPDGKLVEEARPGLGFEFQGVSYTYGPEHYCSPANNLVLDP